MNFELEQLGWKAFEDLALLFAERELGMPVAGFSAGPDGGRDGAALLAQPDSGAWGSVALQAKHSAVRDPLRLSDFKGEVAKVKALTKAGVADTYVLVTNRPISAGSEAHLVKALTAAGVSRPLVFGGEHLVRKLTEDKELRGLIPRVYGLGDLSEILDERLYQQTMALVYEDDIARFVPTQPYSRTLQSLEQHRFALVLGDPASGKSSILRAAAIHSADRWGLEPLWLDSVEDLKHHWNLNRDDQLFLIDDVFGATNMDVERVDDWNRAIGRMSAAMSRGTRFLLTSRNYVYQGARPLLKSHQLPVVRDAEVVIDVESLKPTERRQIVYNHLRLGKQPKEFLTAAKPHLRRLTASRRFLPEVARRLADPRFTVGLDPSDAGALQRFVDDPREHLLTVIDGLSIRLQAALLGLVAAGGRLPNPVPASPTQDEVAARLGVSRYEMSSALAQLDGSLVRLTVEEDSQHWTLRHPTIAEAMGDWLLGRPDLLDLYCQHAPLASLRAQTVCGAEIDGATPLPEPLWPTVFGRMLDTKGHIEIGLRYFAGRCSSKALRTSPRVTDVVAFLERRDFNTPLDGDPKARLFLRLAIDPRIEIDRVRVTSELLTTGVEDLDPYVLTNPAIEELVQDHSEDLGPWPDVVERYIIQCEEQLESAVDAILRVDYGQVDRYDAINGLDLLVAHLVDWLEDGPAVERLLTQQARLREWAGDEMPSLRLQERESSLNAVYGRADAEDDIFSDLDS